MAYRKTIKNVGKEISLGKGNFLSVAIDAHDGQETQAVVSVKGWYTAADGAIAHAKARTGALTVDQAATLGRMLQEAATACDVVQREAKSKIAASEVRESTGADLEAIKARAQALMAAGIPAEVAAREALASLTPVSAPAPKAKRKRRTKAEMVAARAAEATKSAANEASGVVGRLAETVAGLVPAKDC